MNLDNLKCYSFYSIYICIRQEKPLLPSPPNYGGKFAPVALVCLGKLGKFAPIYNWGCAMESRQISRKSGPAPKRGQVSVSITNWHGFRERLRSRAKKPVPIGAIVGGVVGGVVLVAFIAGLLIWRRKRQPTSGATAPAHETYVGDAAYGGQEKYAPSGSPYTQSQPGTPGLGPAPTMNYRNGMYAPVQTQNAGGPHSIAPTTWTGATYVGHPEL
ncbi:hypothetical protein BDV93DRAFT_510756 [Ceratobasidium sp. AG-I]|nr:hypothetical protein BDV93DRAFT_510756 [Ceratobasidium sp. AG-I]